MLTALALDDFVGAAYAAVHDTPEFNPANEGEFVFHTPEPVLVLPRALDLSPPWRGALQRDFMAIEPRDGVSATRWTALISPAQASTTFFERRQEGYARTCGDGDGPPRAICSPISISIFPKSLITTGSAKHSPRSYKLLENAARAQGRLQQGFRRLAPISLISFQRRAKRARVTVVRPRMPPISWCRRHGWGRLRVNIFNHPASCSGP